MTRSRRNKISKVVVWDNLYCKMDKNRGSHTVKFSKRLVFKKFINKLINWHLFLFCTNFCDCMYCKVLNFKKIQNDHNHTTLHLSLKQLEIE